VNDEASTVWAACWQAACRFTGAYFVLARSSAPRFNSPREQVASQLSRPEWRCQRIGRNVEGPSFIPAGKTT